MDAWTKWFINSCTLITFAGYPTDEVCTPSVAQFSRFRIVKLIYLRRSKMINLYDFRFNRLFISLLSTFYLFSHLPEDCCSIPAAWNTVSELCIHFCNLQWVEKKGVINGTWQIEMTSWTFCTSIALLALLIF